MKQKIPKICHHDWADVCIFKTVDSKRYLQQRCTKCKENRYVELKNDQNSSKKEPIANV